jgi:hypothetical protein
MGGFSLPVMSGISDALVGKGVSVSLCNVEDDQRLGQLAPRPLLQAVKPAWERVGGGCSGRL